MYQTQFWLPKRASRVSDIDNVINSQTFIRASVKIKCIGNSVRKAQSVINMHKVFKKNYKSQI